jgi:hypothetical protein
MNLTFRIEWKTAKGGGISTKLFTRSLNGPMRQLKKRIVLNDDDFTNVEHFEFDHSSGRHNLLAHMLSKLMSRPTNLQSLVAWYFSIELASQLLSTSRLTAERMVLVNTEGCVELEEYEIRDFFQTSAGFERCFISSGIIESFLSGERVNNQSGFATIRSRIQQIVTNYLGKELRLLPALVESVTSGIGDIDDSRLDDHVDWISTNPNTYVKEWHKYFVNLRNAPLKLFRPTPLFRKPSRHEKAILNKMTRKLPLLKRYNESTLPEAAFTYLAALMRSGFFERVSGIPKKEIDSYVFHRERAQQPHFMTVDTNLSCTVLNDMSLFVKSNQGHGVESSAYDYLVQHVLTQDPSTLGKCELELLDYFGLSGRLKTNPIPVDKINLSSCRP